MRVKHVVECQFHKWYAQWGKLSIESEIIPLSPEFVAWLDQGKFIVNPGRSTVDDDPDSAFTRQELEQLETAPSQEIFPELCKQIEEQISQLGGAVIPKLNWSSPKDAVWMNWTGDMKCEDAEQVLLLLKSSDCVSHDLVDPFDHCEDKDTQAESVEYYLVLRKWMDIHPASEFRCFVSHNKLIGATQRYPDQHFHYLKDFTSQIIKLLEQFFENKMKGSFSSHTYAFDVYIENMTKRDSSVILLDINPFGRVTDSKLFAWEELFLLHFALEQQPEGDLQSAPLDFRYVSEPIHIQPSLSTSNARPVDCIDVSSTDGLLELIRIQRQQESEQ